MKLYVLSFLLIVCVISSYSQVKFEKGYYISDTGSRVDCLIKNRDWKYNPNSFSFKLTDSSEVQTGSIDTVMEFAILGVSKYVKHAVLMDRSSNSLRDMSTVRSAVFNEEELFLEVLIEGDASLFRFKEGNLDRYFFSVNNSQIRQLVYKRFMGARGTDVINYDKNLILENSRYKQQLWNALKCDVITQSSINVVDYFKKDLVKFFLRYNKCHNSLAENYEEFKGQDSFHISVKVGAYNSSLSLSNSESTYFDMIDFGSQVGYSLGVETEFVMPFNNRKWGFGVGANFQSFSAEKEVLYVNLTTLKKTTMVSVDYKSIEVPFSLRYYMFLNQKSKLFIDASYIVDVTMSSSLYADRKDLLDLDVKSRNNVGLGLGYKFDDKYSVEFKINSSRNILGNYSFWDSNYNKTSIAVGYTLF